MKTEEITCPSGLKGEIRNLKGEEGNILADRRIQKQNKLIDEILRRTWLKTADPGLLGYKIDGAGPKWDDVLAGDRMFAFIQTRILTWGAQYFFKIQCDAPSCARTFEWEIDLADLPVKMLSKESAEVFKKGNRFPVKLPNGEQAFFRLMTGKDERKANQSIQDSRDQLVTLAVKSRLVSIEGVEEKELETFLGDLSLADHKTLIDSFDAHDCGVQTGIEVECPHCLNEFETELPFSADFIFPRTKKKSKAKVSVSGG